MIKVFNIPYLCETHHRGASLYRAKNEWLGQVKNLHLGSPKMIHGRRRRSFQRRHTSCWTEDNRGGCPCDLPIALRQADGNGCVKEVRSSYQAIRIHQNDFFCVLVCSSHSKKNRERYGTLFSRSTVLAARTWSSGMKDTTSAKSQVRPTIVAEFGYRTSWSPLPYPELDRLGRSFSIQNDRFLIKIATRQFSFDHLNRIRLQDRGDFKCVFHRKTSPEMPDLLASTWVDRERRCLISSCSKLWQAQPQVRHRLRQVAPRY